MRKLVICVGNEARGDDGVGPAVADELAGTLPDCVTLRKAAALDISHAEDLRDASLVVFVDAEVRETPAVDVRRLEPRKGASPDAHALNAEGLLALALALYGARPEAWLVSPRAVSTGHEEGLSPGARSAAEEAADAVRRLTA